MVIKSRKKRRRWNLACAGQKSYSYRVLVSRPEGKRPLGNLGIGMGIILECILQTWGRSMWMEFF